jgi:hypothetical protein
LTEGPRVGTWDHSEKSGDFCAGALKAADFPAIFPIVPPQEAATGG